VVLPYLAHPFFAPQGAVNYKKIIFTDHPGGPRHPEKLISIIAPSHILCR
jgi:hypothetical protein